MSFIQVLADSCEATATHSIMDIQLLVGIAVALGAVILAILFFLKGRGATDNKAAEGMIKDIEIVCKAPKDIKINAIIFSSQSSTC